MIGVIGGFLFHYLIGRLADLRGLRERLAKEFGELIRGDLEQTLHRFEQQRVWLEASFARMDEVREARTSIFVDCPVFDVGYIDAGERSGRSRWKLPLGCRSVLEDYRRDVDQVIRELYNVKTLRSLVGLTKLRVDSDMFPVLFRPDSQARSNEASRGSIDPHIPSASAEVDRLATEFKRLGSVVSQHKAGAPWKMTLTSLVVLVWLAVVGVLIPLTQVGDLTGADGLFPDLILMMFMAGILGFLLLLAILMWDIRKVSAFNIWETE